MKLRTALLAITACGLSFSSLADVKLAMPYQAETILVNGVKNNGDKSLTLPNGVNQIAFKFKDSLRENGDDHLFTSDVIVVKFDASDANINLELPKIRSGQEARKFNQEPTFNLVDASGTKVDFTQDKLLKKGLQFGRNYEAEIVAYNQSGQAAAIAPIAAISTAQAVTTLPANAAPQGQNVAENMLMYWYAQADEQTRARFKAAISQ
ncbi:DUF2057 domain-containing protein [Photobacterium ganghwense]|uniref:UPF0319 protein ABT57_13170 n=1 Tax=Photobacterium ganghwense TaxID=320778 RepID=A0A0J1HAT8_9GAMM|nr:DUF2057 domain-containing protein [Photobacterium ganghwense]KLV08754.1 hypothetical protein ABT57_13170 [Photobacterium ganghwense]PSU10881.1 DUF2057 domain-containing protein [Photobacterium ganghwense]QSV12984.1 DUF2057 domain-containing protein [Photobacterium ganghwense]